MEKKKKKQGRGYIACKKVEGERGEGNKKTITYKSYIDQVYTWYETDSDKRATVYDPTDCPSRRRERVYISYISRIYQAPCPFPGPRR